MATIKSYTDLSQSKTLSKILPLESADMCYLPTHIGDEHHFIASLSPYSMCTKMADVSIEYCTPCWSLASLLEQLKSEIRLENKQILYLHLNKYDDTDYEIRYTNSWTGEVLIEEADNLVDACYEMVIRLNELKLL